MYINVKNRSRLVGSNIMNWIYSYLCTNNSKEILFFIFTIITDERARGLLWLEFEKIISIGEKYVKNYGTNTAEAFNHEITKFCPKSINFHSTYVLRANLAALDRVSPKYNWKS